MSRTTAITCCVLLQILSGMPTLAAQESVPTAERPISLQSGDVVRLEVWREPDLSGEFPVDATGSVVFPLIGVRQVAGIPIAALRDTILAEYGRKGIRNPSINITPLRRIYILGEVNAPGPRAVDPTVSLAGAIALAGGANGQGNLRNLEVYRNGELIMKGVAATSQLDGVDIRSGDQIFVGRRSWFDRNSTFLVSAVLSLTSIVISLLR